MEVGVIVSDAQEKILHMNAAAIKLLGLNGTLPQHLKEVGRLYPQAFKASIHHFEQQAIRTQHIPLAEYSLTLLFNTRLEAQRAQESRLAALGQLASNLAHEIRNPLSAIVQANAHLQEQSAPSTLTDIIERQSTRLNQTIETVLSLSKPPKPNISIFTLSDCLSGMMINNPDFSVSLSGEKRPIETDITILQQLLTILIDNAQQYATTISIEVQQSQKGGHIIDIIDNGPGISDSEIPYIFDPFYTTRAGGTGLGLYLGQRLCDALRLELYYVNDTDGAHFQIWIPPTTT
jgi:two-component system sensor histidine kinase PilS (NtrC family)